MAGRGLVPPFVVIRMEGLDHLSDIGFAPVAMCMGQNRTQHSATPLFLSPLPTTSRCLHSNAAAVCSSDYSPSHKVF